MKNLRIYFTSGLAALAVVSALFLLSFESSPPPSLKQKFEAVAKSYLTHHYNQNLAGTQRTLLTNANLDAKVIQLINASCSKKKVHFNYVLSKYKNAPFRAALLVTGATSPAPGEFLMFSLPSNGRVPKYEDMPNFPIFSQPVLSCDSFRTMKGMLEAAGGDLSVFEGGFSAESNCRCVSECNNEKDENNCLPCN